MNLTLWKREESRKMGTFFGLLEFSIGFIDILSRFKSTERKFECNLMWIGEFSSIYRAVRKWKNKNCSFFDSFNLIIFQTRIYNRQHHKISDIFSQNSSSSTTKFLSSSDIDVVVYTREREENNNKKNRNKFYI